MDEKMGSVSPVRFRSDSEVPEPSKVLGVFGLSTYTKTRDLEETFGIHGKIEKVVIVEVPEINKRIREQEDLEGLDSSHSKI
jgi:hypothetical protein